MRFPRMAGESCAAQQSVIESRAAMSIEDKLTELGITLPEAPAAVAAYQPWIRTGNLIFTSGQLPWRDGEIAFAGKLGSEVSDEDGYQAARQCALNAIAQLKAATGDLEKVCTPTFPGPGSSRKSELEKQFPSNSNQYPECHQG